MTDLTENRCFLSYTTKPLTAQHDTIPFELSPRGAPDDTSRNFFSAYTLEQHDQTFVDSFGQLGGVRLTQPTGLYGYSKKANPPLPSSLTTAQDYLDHTIVPDGIEIGLYHGLTHNLVISPLWFEKGELDRLFDLSEQPSTNDQLPSFNMMPELSLLSESTDISGWLHQFSEFNCGTTLQVFVPIAGETTITKAAGSPSQGIYPPEIEGDFNKSSVLSQFTDQPGRPNQLVEFNSSGPSFQGSVPMTERTPKTGDLGSPLKRLIYLRATLIDLEAWCKFLSSSLALSLHGTNRVYLGPTRPPRQRPRYLKRYHV